MDQREENPRLKGQNLCGEALTIGARRPMWLKMEWVRGIAEGHLVKEKTEVPGFAGRLDKEHMVGRSEMPPSPCVQCNPCPLSIG